MFLLLAITVAFPRVGQVLPAVDSTYLIGAVPEGVKTIVVQEKEVEVYHTGAWATTVALTPGENTIKIVEGTNELYYAIKTELPKPPSTNSVAKVAPPKPYEKLAYADDEPKERDEDKVPVVILDPGHGGEKDQGAFSPHGWPEKTFNLRLALAVKAELEKLGLKVVMTRETDVAIALYDRPKVIYDNDGDVFISLHHNAIDYTGSPATRYRTIYAWNELGDGLAKAIAEKADCDTRRANYAVTRNPEIPSCLIEADFITNPAGEADAWNRKKTLDLAQKIALGIAQYLGK